MQLCADTLYWLRSPNYQPMMAKIHIHAICSPFFLCRSLLSFFFRWNLPIFEAAASIRQKNFTLQKKNEQNRVGADGWTQFVKVLQASLVSKMNSHFFFSSVWYDTDYFNSDWPFLEAKRKHTNSFQDEWENAAIFSLLIAGSQQGREVSGDRRRAYEKWGRRENSSGRESRGGKCRTSQIFFPFMMQSRVHEAAVGTLGNIPWSHFYGLFSAFECAISSLPKKNLSVESISQLWKWHD